MLGKVPNQTSHASLRQMSVFPRVPVPIPVSSASRFRGGLLSLSLLGLLSVGSACKPKPPSAGPPIFADNSSTPGPSWAATIATPPRPGSTLTDGALAVRGAFNHPLWLARELPENAVIELDAWSDSPDGDIKVELFGDGQSYAKTVSYTSTGYVVIHGGWKNSLSALCRMDEHADDRRTRKDLKVVPGQRYHYVISRRGSRLEWFIDGELALDEDPAPLTGPSHRYFGFNNWQTRFTLTTCAFARCRPVFLPPDAIQ